MKKRIKWILQVFEKQCLSKPEHEWEEEQIIMEWDKILALLADV